MAYKYKPAAEQAEDKALLDLTQRISREEYFYDLLKVNKLGIEDPDELTQAERAISGYRNNQLEKNFIPGRFDFEHLKATHGHLFQDLYYFAGQTRDMNMQIDSVTIFTSGKRVESEGKRIFDNLKNDNYLKGLQKPEFVHKFADYLTDVNILHPFREGNGRTKRAFFTELSKQAGYSFDYDKVDKRQWLLADEIAFDSSHDINNSRDTQFLEMLLNKAISPLEDEQQDGAARADVPASKAPGAVKPATVKQPRKISEDVME